jgi:cytidylate kinase
MIMDKEGQTSAAAKTWPKITHASAQVKATRMMKREDVQRMLQNAAQGAADRIEKLSMYAESEKVQLDANRDILDRAGYKPVHHIESKNLSVDVKMDVSDPRAKELKEKFEQELFNTLNDD